jgi:hypothetical protein
VKRILLVLTVVATFFVSAAPAQANLDPGDLRVHEIAAPPALSECVLDSGGFAEAPAAPRDVKIRWMGFDCPSGGLFHFASVQILLVHAGSGTVIKTVHTWTGLATVNHFPTGVIETTCPRGWSVRAKVIYTRVITEHHLSYWTPTRVCP